ncbi:MAG: hypothetical protein VXA88_09625 [Rhodospirillales bacterium]
MDNLAMINSIKAKRERKKAAGPVHPLVAKRLKQREEANGPDKRKAFTRSRYPANPASGDGSSKIDEQPDIRDGISGDIEPLL